MNAIIAKPDVALPHKTRYRAVFISDMHLGTRGCRTVTLRNEASHTTADGRRLLVIHGDEFDSVLRYARFLAVLGTGPTPRPWW